MSSPHKSGPPPLASGRPDTSAWQLVGETVNCRYYAIERNILAVVPFENSTDDSTTAPENVEFQNRYFREHGPGVSLIFIEGAASQDKGARQVYRERADLSVYLGASMIGVSPLARAIGSFFLGLSRTPLPFKLAGSYPEALAWARKLIAERESLRA